MNKTVTNGSDFNVIISIERFDSFIAEFYTDGKNKVVFTEKEVVQQSSGQYKFNLSDYTLEDGWLYCKLAINTELGKIVRIYRTSVYLSSDYSIEGTCDNWELWLNKEIDNNSISIVRITKNLLATTSLIEAKNYVDRRPIVVKNYINYGSAENSLKNAISNAGLNYDTYSKYFTIK